MSLIMNGLEKGKKTLDAHQQFRIGLGLRGGKSVSTVPTRGIVIMNEVYALRAAIHDHNSYSIT